MTFWKPEYENIGGFGDPTARYPLGEEHMTGFKSKQAAAQAKLNDDDDIQDYKREWVGLTEEEVKHLYPYGRSVWGRETFEAIEKALKEKNT